MKELMSFFCPWQDAHFEKCRRTGDTPCRPGKSGCVLFGKVEWIGAGSVREGREVEKSKREHRRGDPSAGSTTDDRLSTRSELLTRLGSFPALLRHDLAAVPAETKIGRWSVAQVVHHLADVHAAGLARVRRALTEVDPRVESYDHESWARLDDAGRAHLVEASLAILDGIHARWTALLGSLHEDGWVRTYRKTQSRRRVTVEEDLAWHVCHGEEHRRAILSAAPQGVGS